MKCSLGHPLITSHWCAYVPLERVKPVSELAERLKLTYWYIPCGPATRPIKIGGYDVVWQRRKGMENS